MIDMIIQYFHNSFTPKNEAWSMKRRLKRFTSESPRQLPRRRSEPEKKNPNHYTEEPPVHLNRQEIVSEVNELRLIILNRILMLLTIATAFVFVITLLQGFSLWGFNLPHDCFIWLTRAVIGAIVSAIITMVAWLFYRRKEGYK
jgi:hypothetical protein